MFQKEEWRYMAHMHSFEEGTGKYLMATKDKCKHVIALVQRRSPLEKELLF